MASWDLGRMVTLGWGGSCICRNSLTAQHEFNPSGPAAPPGPYHTPCSNSQASFWGKTCIHVFTDVITQGGTTTSVALRLSSIWVKLVLRILPRLGVVR